MTRHPLIILSMAIVALAGCRTPAPSSFNIYLPSEPVDRSITVYGPADASHIRLSGTPLISGSDIIHYDFANHSMKLQHETIRRIPQPRADGIPFVVVANGEAIYRGVFVSTFSSLSFAVPCIVMDSGFLAPNKSPDTLIIQRAYPGVSSGLGPDPRGDPRIRRALAGLHKLKRDH
jgi:hypothetical protein